MSRMIPFIYNSSIAYPVELGEHYASFFYNGNLLDTDGAPIETPYLNADLFKLQHQQLNDVMWIVAEDYAPRKLSRTTTTTFSLDQIVFKRGPFKVRNDLLNDDGVTMTYDHTTDLVAIGSVGTLTSSAAYFEVGHIGALFNLTYPRDFVCSKGELSDHGILCAEIDVKGKVSFKTGGTWSGSVLLWRKEGYSDFVPYRTFTSNNDYNERLTYPENSDNVKYKAIVTQADWKSGTISGAIEVKTTTQDGVVRIDSIISPTVAVCTVMETLPTTNGLVATYQWAEGYWCPKNGYPVSMTFFENRAVYVGQGMAWFSKTGEYENFENGIKDADSFDVVIPSGNTIQWVEALISIIVGTSGDEWSISSNKLGTPITPLNHPILKETIVGSCGIQPVRVNESLLFVDSVQKYIREFTLGDKTKYYVNNLSSLAEHLTNSSTISGLCYQKNPDTVIWTWLANGDCQSMTFNKEQQVVAWAEMPTDGDVQSMCVIPANGEDEVWLSVLRNLNGTDTTCIERFAPRTLPTAKEDCFFVDSGVTYDGVATTTITGLDHLEGETVEILADGVVLTPQVVSGGQITLTTPASVVQVGLPYYHQVEPMRMDVGTGGGTTHGSIKKIHELVFSLLNSSNVKYGDSTSELYDIITTSAEVINKSTITGLFSGDVTVHSASGFSIDDPIIIYGKDPVPVTVRAIIARTDMTGR